MKISIISFGFIICFCFTRCSTDKIKREVKGLYVDVYMSSYSIKDKKIHLMDSIEAGINRAFGLLPLEKSTSRHEIRIYYLNVWFESFLRQRYDSGKLISELYNCKTKRTNDSMTMSIGTRITDVRTYSLDSFLNTQSLPIYKVAYSDYEGVADGGNLHFIQIKEPGVKKKLICVDDVFDLESNDAEVKEVCNYLRTLKKRFNFNMFDQWDEIKAKAFLNN